MDTQRMRRMFAAGVLALVLMMGAGSTAFAQVDSTPVTTEVDDDDDWFDWGWLGLLGLFGLAGLRGGTRSEPITTRRDGTHTDAEPRTKR